MMNNATTLQDHHGTWVTPVQLNIFGDQQLDYLVSEPGTHHAQMSHPLCSGSGSTQGDWTYSKSVVPNGVNNTEFPCINGRISASNIVDKHLQANKKTRVTLHEILAHCRGHYITNPNNALWANHSKVP